MRRERRYYVYIMASRSLNFYTGITDDIYRRALEHKSSDLPGFAKRYNINRLVYYETFRYVNNAIFREKQIKAWTRAKRIALIRGLNPTWQDLAEGWGEKLELQIPRCARDDNKSRVELVRVPVAKAELQIPRIAKDRHKSRVEPIPRFAEKLELQISRSARDDNKFEEPAAVGNSAAATTKSKIKD